MQNKGKVVFYEMISSTYDLKNLKSTKRQKELLRKGNIPNRSFKCSKTT
jgi:hypothetical protein